MPAAVRMKVREVDRGLRKLFADVQQAKDGLHVKIGLLDSGKGAAPHGSLTTAELGAVHEFGTKDGRIPARSFIRSTFTAKRADYAAMLRAGLLAFTQGKVKLPAVFNAIGMRGAADMKLRVTAGASLPPKLADSTVAMRAMRDKGVNRAKAKADRVSARLLGGGSAAGPITAQQHAKLEMKHSDAQMGVLSALSSVRSGMRALVDSGRMIGAITWDVVKGKK